MLGLPYHPIANEVSLTLKIVINRLSIQHIAVLEAWHKTLHNRDLFQMFTVGSAVFILTLT